MNRRRRQVWRTIAAALALLGAAEATPRPPNPSEIIGNNECRMKLAREHALLYWPSGEGTRFAILDDAGTVFGGELPFTSNYYRKTFLVERGDGSVLFAFANLAYESSVYALPDADAPVRVFLNGKLIYETDNAGEFDVASDGSTFFVLEPLAEDVRNLVIHEVGAGPVRSINLAERFAAFGIPEPAKYRGYVARYSQTQDEVMVMPARESVEASPYSSHKYYRSNGPGSYLFYPIHGGERRTFVATDRLALFVSSRHAYFANRCSQGFNFNGFLASSGGETEVSKRRFLWDGSGESKQTEVWTRNLDLDGFRGFSDEMSLIGDGAWLMLDAANHHILDAGTGEIVFAFPTTKNLSRTDGLAVTPWIPSDGAGIARYTPIGRAYFDRALARLGNVLPFGATVDDVQVMSGYRIENGDLVLSQHVRQETAPGEPLKYKQFEYLFDMEDIHAEATPKARRETEIKWNFGPPDDVCRVDAAAGGGALRVRGDKIVYQSTEQSTP